MNRLIKPIVLGIALLAGSTAIAGVTFYDAENFAGRQLRGDQPMPNFRSLDFNDRARSAIIDGGPWEVCVGTQFDNDCTVLAPGRYPTLGKLSHKISSARPVNEPVSEPRRERTRGGAGATLYSGADLTGRAYPLGGQGSGNLEGAFNDRGSSLSVERGYWIFCSDANFQGECRTFGPGEYRNLPPELDNRISSGRRISSDYPYADQPAWR